MTPEEQRESALLLLNEQHDFPCDFVFKVIGKATDDFVQRVVSCIQDCLPGDTEPPHRTRSTPNGKHISVTLEPVITSAEEVLRVYAELKTIDGVVMVM